MGSIPSIMDLGVVLITSANFFLSLEEEEEDFSLVSLEEDFPLEDDLSFEADLYLDWASSECARECSPPDISKIGKVIECYSLNK